MANQFLLKYSATSGVVPTSAELPLRQIALNTADGKLFIKKTDGTILTFESAGAFARAVHSHVISDVTGLQDALDTLTSAAAAAQSGADASLKIASNLSDLASVSTARTNLGVDSSSEVDGKIATSKSASDAYTDSAIAALINGSPATLDTLKEIADALKSGEDVATALASSISSVSSRVSTLEGQNLDSRITTAQSAAEAAQSTANSAVTAAAAAQSTADSAVTAAATAQSAAEAAQSSADSAASAAAAAQSGADASLKKAANLGDLADAAQSRTNLEVDSSSEVDSKISTAVGSAQSTLQSTVDSVSSRVTTLEGQNLDSRLSSTESSIAGLGTMSVQNADNVNITGGSIGAGSVPTDSGVILTENSTLDGGTFSGFNGGGGGGGSTPWYGDASVAAHTITLNGTVTQSNEGNGVVAAMFDGSTGSLSTEQNSSLDISAGDSTIEFWVKPTQYAYESIISSPGSLNIHVYVDGNLHVNNAQASDAMVPIALNTWQHVAVVVASGSKYVFVNGALQATTTQLFGSTSVFDIGKLNSEAFFSGSLAGLRIVKGSALYSNSFTVPSLPTAVSGTELLLNFGATTAPSV
jgi:hypothetical protein